MKRNYKGFEIQITGMPRGESHDFMASNTPYGFVLSKDGEYVNSYNKFASSEAYALGVAKEWVNKRIKREAAKMDPNLYMVLNRK